MPLATTCIAGYVSGVRSCFDQFRDLMRAERMAFGCEAWSCWSSSCSSRRKRNHLLSSLLLLLLLLHHMCKFRFELGDFAFGRRVGFGVFQLQSLGLR